MVWFLGLAGCLAVGCIVCLEIRRSKPGAEEPTEDARVTLAARMQEDLEAIQRGEVLEPVDPDETLDPKTLEKLVNAAPREEIPAQAAEAQADNVLQQAMTEDAAQDEPDTMILTWDDTAGPKPDVALAAKPGDPNLTDIFLGKTRVATVRTRRALTPDAITLIPLSKAIKLGWAA